jgi:hypothetical protein
MLSREELADPVRLAQEANRYAAQMLAEDDAMQYPMGCPNGAWNKAFCYTIEAARVMCGGKSDADSAAKLIKALLRLANKEINAAD